MDDYLSKPFQAEQLIAIVTKWIGIRQMVKGSTAASA
jgi:CheY-like chemotaxis protein